MTTIARDQPKVNMPTGQAVGARYAYLLTIRVVGDDPPGMIPFLASDDRQAIGQAVLWWSAQPENDRRTMTVEIAPLQLGRLADGGASVGPVLWIYRGAETEGGVL